MQGVKNRKEKRKFNLVRGTVVKTESTLQRLES